MRREANDTRTNPLARARHQGTGLDQAGGEMTASTIARTCETDLESRAIAMLDDEQAFASFGRWMEVVNAAKRARSLREKLGVEEYVAAIYREIPA